MPKLILVIEDSQAIAELYQDVLSDAGYEVRVIASKPEDVQILEQIQPDLIISDWMIYPEEDSWDFINSIKNTPATARIPVVVCTGISLNVNNLDSRLREQKIEALAKPFDIDELLRVVEKTIGF